MKKRGLIEKQLNKVEKIIVKKKKQILLANIIIGLIVFFLIGVINISYSFIAAFFIIIIYLMISNRRMLFYHLIISFIIVLIWMLLAKDQYSYSYDFLTVFGLNTFPLFAWTVGLFWIYVLYLLCEYHLRKKGFAKKIILFILVYWPILIAVETIAYHFFSVKNFPTALYSGLPICNCLHAPWWMKTAYFSMGLIFFTACYLLKLEKDCKPKK